MHYIAESNSIISVRSQFEIFESTSECKVRISYESLKCPYAWAQLALESWALHLLGYIIDAILMKISLTVIKFRNWSRFKSRVSMTLCIVNVRLFNPKERDPKQVDSLPVFNLEFPIIDQTEVNPSWSCLWILEIYSFHLIACFALGVFSFFLLYVAFV